MKYAIFVQKHIDNLVNKSNCIKTNLSEDFYTLVGHKINNSTSTYKVKHINSIFKSLRFRKQDVECFVLSIKLH